MDLGAFSISLAVKDIEASRDFQGMFERNILTFNPGWDREGRPIDSFTDVRELQRRIRELGVKPVTEADEAGSGPASFVLVDPDGNPVLVDQHV
jgi:lactoylglutathione lyase